ncbi:centrosome and spindle pole-associated protein 1-like [Hypomesus transpacificus]|uniref:centrosome and spindle pole-associated protein 1-like n=1 Tax=Hypomesus transpacificus TaxID=137520 RepID=UPI001F086A5B|nr:centrosome and spindle pole-associated protein 1-like [Hypomesus transpacificus]
MKNYNPWGRGGCGAPLRDTRGDLITDLKQMHRQNEEAWLNPETSLKKATRPILREDRLPPINTVSGFAPVQTSMFARGNVFPNQPTLHQLTELDKYKLGLKQQIEEKHLKEAEEREKLRLEEAKEERRLAEQRAQI